MRVKRKTVGYLCLAIALTLFIITKAYSQSNSQTHSLDTSTYYFTLDNGSSLKFDSNPIYLGDSNGLWSWIDNDSIKFYSLRTEASDCPNPWHIKLSGLANVTVTKLFENEQWEATVSANSGVTSITQVYCGSKGEPTSVSGADSWSYDSSTKVCTITVAHSSSQTVTLDWSEIPSTAYEQAKTSVLSHGYIAMTLSSLTFILTLAVGIITLVSEQGSTEDFMMLVITATVAFIAVYVVTIMIGSFTNI